MSCLFRRIGFPSERRTPLLRGITITILSALSLLSPGTMFAQGYIVVDVGSLGGNMAASTGINDQGQVVGYGYLADNVTYHPFLWDSVHGMQDLGVLSGFQSGFALGINNLGQVAGDCDTYPFTNQNGFVWDAVHGMRDLGTATGTDSGFVGINDAGQIAGYYYPGTDRAILHDGSGSLSTSDDLGILPGGTESFAFGLNNAGQVAGTGDTDSGDQHAVVWDGFSGVQHLGMLPGGSLAWAEDINDSGDVVGFSDTSLGPYHAFVYSGGEMTDLGTLPGYPHSMAFGIDPSGTQVVGQASLHGFPTDNPIANPMHGVLWRDGLIYDLNTLIAPGSGWVFEGAFRINAHGQITGSGYNGSQRHALLLDPIVLSSLTVSPTTVAGSKTATGKVTLTAPAVVDAYVDLASQNPAAIVPSSVKIAAGHSSASFTIKTTAVSAPVTGQIMAFDGVYQSALLTVRPIGVKSVSISPSSVVGGNSVNGTVMLESPAAPGSITVSLSSTDPAVANPAVSSITIAAGSQTGTFTVNTSHVAANTSVTIKASANGITKGKALTITP